MRDTRNTFDMTSGLSKSATPERDTLKIQSRLTKKSYEADTIREVDSLIEQTSKGSKPSNSTLNVKMPETSKFIKSFFSSKV